MKKYEVKESFILEAHDNACSEWKNRIEKEVPELFRYEKNKWYKGCNVIGFYKGDSGNYGINNGSWSNTINMSAIETWELMTIEEVETALIAEAKKRGFKEGVNIQPDFNVWTHYLGGKCIFSDGKWAEIIEEAPQEITMSELEKELGRKIKIVK